LRGFDVKRTLRIAFADVAVGRRRSIANQIAIASKGRIPALRRSQSNGKNAQEAVIPRRRREQVKSTFAVFPYQLWDGRSAAGSGRRWYGQLIGAVAGR
jgi:hypothetical protein